MQVLFLSITIVTSYVHDILFTSPAPEFYMRSIWQSFESCKAGMNFKRNTNKGVCK